MYMYILTTKICCCGQLSDNGSCFPIASRFLYFFIWPRVSAYWAQGGESFNADKNDNIDVALCFKEIFKSYIKRLKRNEDTAVKFIRNLHFLILFQRLGSNPRLGAYICPTHLCLCRGSCFYQSRKLTCRVVSRSLSPAAASTFVHFFSLSPRLR